MRLVSPPLSPAWGGVGQETEGSHRTLPPLTPPPLKDLNRGSGSLSVSVPCVLFYGLVWQPDQPNNNNTGKERSCDHLTVQIGAPVIQDTLFSTVHLLPTIMHVSSDNTNTWGFERLHQWSGVKCNIHLLLTSRPFRDFKDLISEVLASFWTPDDFPLLVDSFSNLQQKLVIKFLLKYLFIYFYYFERTTLVKESPTLTLWRKPCPWVRKKSLCVAQSC